VVSARDRAKARTRQLKEEKRKEKEMQREEAEENRKRAGESAVDHHMIVANCLLFVTCYLSGRLQRR
jgi:hypothetical protein